MNILIDTIRVAGFRGIKNLEVSLPKPCPYGGRQAYFICPTCDRHVCSLYKINGIACRKCHRLIYASQSQRCDDRWNEQANKIRKKLGWKLGALNEWGERPRYMHEQTYQVLVMKLLHYTSKIQKYMQQQIDKWKSNSIHDCARCPRRQKLDPQSLKFISQMTKYRGGSTASWYR